MSVLVVGISHKTAPVSVLERVALDSDGRDQAAPRGLRPRARHRGDRALDLQPHRGLHRRRPVPRQRRGDLADARRAGRPVAGGRALPPLRALRRRRRLAPVPRRRRPRLDGARARARSSARPARRCGWARSTAPSARPSTCCSSRPCASASARTPRPTSTGSRPSLVASALDRAADHVGDLAGKHVVIVGAGSMAGLTAATASARGCRLDHGRQPYAGAGGPPRPAVRRHGDPALRPRRASPVRSTCSSRAPARPASLIDFDAVASRRRDDRPLAVVDLALPRDVDPEVAAPSRRTADRPGHPRRRARGRPGRRRRRGRAHDRRPGARRVPRRPPQPERDADRGGAAHDGDRRGRGRAGPAAAPDARPRRLRARRGREDPAPRRREAAPPADRARQGAGQRLRCGLLRRRAGRAVRARPRGRRGRDPRRRGSRDDPDCDQDPHRHPRLRRWPAPRASWSPMP